jgi:hypothetical protein
MEENIASLEPKPPIDGSLDSNLVKESETVEENANEVRETEPVQRKLIA